MDVNDVYELMKRFDASQAGYLELQIGSDCLKLKKPSCQKHKEQNIFQMVPGAVAGGMTGTAVSAGVSGGMSEVQQGAERASGEAGAAAQQSSLPAIKAPLVGIFYASASPDQEPFVKVGSQVKKGDTVCLIEAMKMMSEVTAQQDGIIREILVENGDAVAFDQPLFRIQE